jgi:hypothetical protein
MTEIYEPSEMALAAASLACLRDVPPTVIKSGGLVFLEDANKENWRVNSRVIDFSDGVGDEIHAQFHVEKTVGNVLHVHSIVEKEASKECQAWAFKKEHLLGAMMLKGESPERPHLRWVAAFVDALRFTAEEEFISVKLSSSTDEIEMRWNHLTVIVRQASPGSYTHWELLTPHYQVGSGNMVQFIPVDDRSELKAIRSLLEDAGGKIR